MSEKIALISGASSGFGYELSKILVQEKGWKVIGLARRAEKLEALKKELADNFLPLVLDISKLDYIPSSIDILPENWQDISLLVNNAGLARGLTSADKTELSDWYEMVDTNIKGLITLTHTILPRMVAKNKGHIVNLSSTAANYPYYGSNVYGATKAFVKQFSLNLRADLVGTKVRVSNIEPGLIAGTEFSNVRFKGNDEKAAAVYEGVENMTGKDIAEIIAWIVEMPEHINVNRIEIMPTAQTFAGLKVVKKES